MFETRDGGLLKLFFSGAAPGAAPKAIEAKRAYHEEKLRQLADIEPMAKAAPDPYPYLVLRHGIAHSEFVVRWCDEALAELSEEDGSRRKARSA